MRVLLTNDDGIHAPGMALLEAIAARLSDDVWVCAPAQENDNRRLRAESTQLIKDKRLAPHTRHRSRP